MRTLRVVWARLKGSWRTRRQEQDLADELESHLQLEIEDGLRRGLPAHEARRVAHLRSGGIAAAKEAYGDRRGVPFLEQLVQDLRYGARHLRKRPGFAVAAVSTLALGIGANTAIFSLVHAALLDDPPYAAPSRLVSVTQSFPAIGEARLGVSPPEYVDYRDRTRAFSSLAGYSHVAFDMTGTGEAERVDAVRATASLFETLAVAPLLGRAFTIADESIGAPRVVLLAFDFWQRRHAGDPRVLGTSITLNEQPHTIVGVMPAGFEFPARRATVGEPPAMWVPLSFTARQLAARAASFETHVVARLGPGVSVERARGDATRVADEFQREHPDIYRGRIRLQATVDSLTADATAKVRPVLLMLAGTVALVLLAACANVANLLLVRASARQKEMAVRRALGAGRGRIIRQLLTESLLLSGFGGVLGCLLAALLTGAASTLWPGQEISLRGVRLDGMVLAFTVGLSMLTGVLCGLAPIAGFGGGAADSLKQAGRQIGDGRQSRRVRDALVVFEVATASVLLVGAGLLLHSFVNVTSVALGFEPSDVLVVRTTFNRQRYPDAARRHAAERAIVERLAALPAVEKVGLTTHIPLADDRTIGFAIEPDGPDQAHWAANALVSGEYFAAMGIRLVRGRSFGEADREGSPPVAIINETLARRHLRDRDPVGAHVLWGGRRLTIVGVAGDVHVSGLDRDVEPMIYCPVYQIESGATTSAVFVLRTSGGSATEVTSAARAVIRSIDAGLPVFDVRPMREIVRRSLATRQALVAVLIAFAGVGLLLAIGGLYAVLSHAVAQRTQELGVRVALGAKPSDLVAMVVTAGVRLVSVGLAFGALAALAATGGLRAQLFGVERWDPASFIVAAAVLLTVSLFASYRVGRRASRIDPITALRAE